MLFYDILQLSSKQLMKLTIFTPTYNRAYLLPQLFASLQKQKLKIFEWLIVDDGSQDNTEQIVKQFQKEADFPIRYIYQKNQGKHIAINTGVNNTLTEFFLTVDSDDEMMENAMENISSTLPSLTENSTLAAIVFPRYSLLNNSTKTNITIPFSEEISDSIGIRKKYNLFGEFDYIFKTEILKKFQFPHFVSEKFIKESLIYKRIDKNYKNLYINKSIIQGEYLEDGLSSNFRNLLEKNPLGAALAYLETVNDKRLNFQEQKEAFKNYWYFANLAKQDSSLMRLLKVRNKSIIFNFLLEKLK